MFLSLSDATMRSLHAWTIVRTASGIRRNKNARSGPLALMEKKSQVKRECRTTDRNAMRLWDALRSRVFWIAGSWVRPHRLESGLTPTLA
jgi:hypothetical protein